MKCLKNLSPQPLWNYFEEICQVPRPSKKEEKIIRFLLDFAAKNGLKARQDEIGNVLISKPGTPGRENDQVVILQSHVDMVCEKNSETKHDFEVDAIKAYIDDGWVRAQGTTLGSDDGIGMAAQMAVLTSTDLSHGPIECLFTVDEETGLSGAFALEPGFLSGSTLVNLDSEDEGELFIGCAGGIDSVGTLKYTPDALPAGSFAAKLEVKGLLGGHSGDDINKNRGNANKILNRFLIDASKLFDLRVADFNGGNLRNAIPREAFGVITVPYATADKLVGLIAGLTNIIKRELIVTEPTLKIELAKTEMPAGLIDEETQIKLTHAIVACPNGAIRMSDSMPGLVETSTNLAIVKSDSTTKTVNVACLMRSSVDSAKAELGSRMESVFTLAGAEVKLTGGYPGWKPDMDSPILKTMQQVYQAKFGRIPEIKAIHAGLECGILGGTYPGWDMISFGPTIRFPHSPDEKVNIESVAKFWDFLVETLKNIPAK